MTDKTLWTEVNQELIAKSLGELFFEQILLPTEGDLWKLELKSQVTYEFHAWKTTWEYLRVDPSTIRRNGESTDSAAQFFIDSQAETQMSDITLSNFLEEMHMTLFSDLNIKKAAKKLTVKELAQWDGEKQQSALNGHPKILLNKGRIGWGEEALRMYAPENKNPMKLHWLAVKTTNALGITPTQNNLDESFTSSEKLTFLRKAASLLEDINDYFFLPVHPWQWDRFIQIQYASLLANRTLVSLGIAGDEYLPQISIRTLSNTSRKDRADIKLPLSILNTSCVRGLPAKGITIGQELSNALTLICEQDPILQNVEVLHEKFGVSIPHPSYAKIKEAPYRYHEYLGAIWRESASSKTKANEKAILTSALYFQDEKKSSLIGEYIKLSKISPKDWLKAYFKEVVIPLYHLQLEYGLGMVAHGQNIVLKLRDNLPCGLILKDFQGDLRLSNALPEKGEKHLGRLKEHLTALPPHYLIHDLITGHFITVLRFLSATMKESDQFSENEFYQILSQEIKQYMSDRIVPKELNLLNKTFDRVLLNKVRFKIGYADNAERPLPLLGEELNNPLFRYLE